MSTCKQSGIDEQNPVRTEPCHWIQICLLPLHGCIKLETDGSEKRLGGERESWHKHAPAWNFLTRKAKKETAAIMRKGKRKKDRGEKQKAFRGEVPVAVARISPGTHSLSVQRPTLPISCLQRIEVISCILHARV